MERSVCPFIVFPAIIIDSVFPLVLTSCHRLIVLDPSYLSYGTLYIPSGWMLYIGIAFLSHFTVFVNTCFSCCHPFSILCPRTTVILLFFSLNIKLKLYLRPANTLSLFSSRVPVPLLLKCDSRGNSNRPTSVLPRPTC